MAAAAACLSCLQCGNGVLGLLGVCTSSDKLLLQSAVLQEKGNNMLKGNM